MKHLCNLMSVNVAHYLNENIVRDTSNIEQLLLHNSKRIENVSNDNTENQACISRTIMKA